MSIFPDNFSCHKLLETMPDPVVVVNQDGNIVEINNQTEKRFGYSREELLYKPVETLVPKMLRKKHSKYRKQYFSENKGARPMGTRLVLSGVRKDGSIIPVDISLNHLKIDSDYYAIAAIRDVSDLAKAHEETLMGWSLAMDFRDKETEKHTQRVTQMTVEIASKMELSQTAILHIRQGALLHDIGKMAVPDNILLKPDKLTDEEWAIMRKHPEHAYEMLWPIEFLRPAIRYTLLPSRKMGWNRLSAWTER